MKRIFTNIFCCKNVVLHVLFTFLLSNINNCTNAQGIGGPGSAGQTGTWIAGSTAICNNNGYTLKLPAQWIGNAVNEQLYTFPFGTYNTEYIYIYNISTGDIFAMGTFVAVNANNPDNGATNLYNFLYKHSPTLAHTVGAEKFCLKLNSETIFDQFNALLFRTYLSHNANTSPSSICEGSIFTSTLTDVHPGVYQLKDMATGTILSAPVTVTADAPLLTLTSYPITASLFAGNVLPTSLQNFATYNGSSYDAAPSERRIYNDTVTYYQNPGLNFPGTYSTIAVNLVQPITITPNLSNITVGAVNNNICPNNTATITTTSSQTSKYYVLEDNATGTRLNAPTLATGAALNMTTAPLSSTTTIRVKALQELRHLRFDGVNDYINTPATALGVSGTWEAWVQKDNWADHHDDQLISNGINFPTNGSFYVSLHPAVGFHFRYGGQGQVGNNYVSTPVTQSFAANSWHHLAATWFYNGTNTTLNLYVDGVFKAAATSGMLLGNSPNIKLGSNAIAGQNTYFGAGNMRDIRLWNSAKSAAEIATNYFKELTGAETGLIANYKLDATTGSTAADASPNNNTGTLTNFTLPQAWDVNSTCNGASFIMSQMQTINVSEESAALANASISQVLTLNNPTEVYFSANCTDYIAKLTPNGSNPPLNGFATAKVWIDATQPAQYVKRHYEITPQNYVATGTAKIKLFFTQQNFNDFNAVNTMKLPIDAADAANNKANLLIEKRSGTSSDNSGNPNTYTGNIVTIDPADTDIIWNASMNRWEVSFDVTGFSGFFVKTVGSILPISWLGVYANLNTQKQTLINWEVQEIDVAKYEIEKGADGRFFKTIGFVNSSSNGTNTYNYLDNDVLQQTTYYRLKQINANGSFTYSAILKVSTKQPLIEIYPNPFKNQIAISIPFTLLNSTAIIYTTTGKKIKEILLNNLSKIVDLENLLPGIYLIQFENGLVHKIVKE
jgi:Concanavalin A-like lectin/glucanases superfamily/Secretion system C-terminal sorting domain